MNPLQKTEEITNKSKKRLMKSFLAFVCCCLSICSQVLVYARIGNGQVMLLQYLHRSVSRLLGNGHQVSPFRVHMRNQCLPVIIRGKVGPLFHQVPIIVPLSSVGIFSSLFSVHFHVYQQGCFVTSYSRFSYT